MHALVTADTIGGVWTYVRELVTGLVARGVQVTLVSFGEIPTSQQTSWIDGLAGVDFRPTGFRLEWMHEADIEASSEYLASTVREVRPDVLHLNQFCYGALSVNVPRIVVAHSDVVSWWVAVHDEEPRDGTWMQWYREIVLRGVRGATAVVAPSLWMLRCVRKHYASPARERVIYNGRTPHMFNPHITKEGYALSVGRVWDGGKQISLLRQIDPPMPVYIAGAQDHADATLRAPVRGGARKKNLHMKGPQNEAQLRQLYSRASIYAATSRYEPFGLAPLEAALSRCAIVANDIPSFHEIWGDSAYYFSLNDPAALEAALRELAENEELCRRFANRAYEHARQHYSADRMVDDYLDLYKTVVETEAAAA